MRVARKEAQSFLTPAQYVALVDIAKGLVDYPSGGAGVDGLRIEPIDEFIELKEKGGIFGKINVRVYFAHIKEVRTIWILGCEKKEAEHQTPKHVVIRMRNRLREKRKQLGL